MTEGLNRVTLAGNLGADAELNHMPTGRAVLNFRIATTEVYFDKDKQRKERTEWHRVALFGPRAEALARFLVKGSAVLVEGYLHTSSYEKNGEKRFRTEVIANNVVLLGGRRREAANGTTVTPTSAAELETMPF